MIKVGDVITMNGQRKKVVGLGDNLLILTEDPMDQKPNIFKSRKFWIAVTDAVVSLVGLYTGFFLAPEYAELVMATVAALQIPVGVLIAAIAYEDGQYMRSKGE